MHFSTLLPALLVLASSAIAGPAPANEVTARSLKDRSLKDISLREAGPEVVKRAACTCKKVSNPGLYCGSCDQVTSYTGDKWEWVFWCNKQGGCDDIGFRKSCRDSGTPCDGRDS